MGLGPPELSLSLGWAGEALPNPRDTRPGSLPTLPSPERIWAALKQKKKMGKGSPLGGSSPMSLPQTQQVMESRRGSVTFPPQNWAGRAEILMDLVVPHVPGAGD